MIFRYPGVTALSYYVIARSTESCTRWVEAATGSLITIGPTTTYDYADFVIELAEENFQGTLTGMFCADLPDCLFSVCGCADIVVYRRDGAEPAAGDTHLSLSRLCKSGCKSSNCNSSPSAIVYRQGKTSCC